MKNKWNTRRPVDGPHAGGRSDGLLCRWRERSARWTQGPGTLYLRRGGIYYAAEAVRVMQWSVSWAISRHWRRWTGKGASWIPAV